MASCLIVGGSGFIGTHLARHFLRTQRFSRVNIADIRPSALSGEPGVAVHTADVRKPLAISIAPPPEWIFNLAAVHREPGHQLSEYFDTNIAGAKNVCDYAEAVGCKNIFFTSSISVYGPTHGPVSEAAPIRPNSPYGASKYPAELVHEAWLRAGDNRRLIICRPGVVYGPGDPGNVLRMIKAIKRGYFALPGRAEIRKSYGYIYGLIDSVEFAMARSERFIRYNYVENPTETMGELIDHIRVVLSSRAPVLHIPKSLLLPVAHVCQALLGHRSPVHPIRVRKAAAGSHIIAGWLQDAGFQFKYPFRRSLEHWRQVSPSDFD